MSRTSIEDEKEPPNIVWLDMHTEKIREEEAPGNDLYSL